MKMNIRAVKDSLERLGELQRNGDPENYYQLSEKPFLEIQAKKDEDDDFTKPFDRIQVLQGTDRDEVLSHYKAMKKDLLKKGKTSRGSVDAFLFNKELEEKLHLRDPLEERDYRTISHKYYLNNKTHRAILEIERYNHLVKKFREAEEEYLRYFYELKDIDIEKLDDKFEHFNHYVTKNCLPIQDVFGEKA